MRRNFDLTKADDDEDDTLTIVVYFSQLAFCEFTTNLLPTTYYCYAALEHNADNSHSILSFVVVVVVVVVGSGCKGSTPLTMPASTREQWIW